METRGGEAWVQEREIMCIYFKYSHPHNQKMHFIRETVLLCAPNGGGGSSSFMVGNCSPSTPKDNIAFCHSSVKMNGVTLGASTNNKSTIHPDDGFRGSHN